MGKKIDTRRFLLTQTARKQATFKQHFMADLTPSMEREAVGRESPSKSRCRQDLMARPTKTIWLLKIPALPLSPAFLVRLSQGDSSFPLFLPSFLPFLLLLLPRFSPGCQPAMPLVLIEPLTLATDLPAFISFPLSSGESHERFCLPALQTRSLTFLWLCFADFIPLHQ
jgi:hypothetical protein